ncbi:unnamed protein product [Adineta ricciae]|uniref:Uncharacterized protein n=1 Tax=Adineta ricciae TaxID=249248 RepID=A0A815XWI9_ADIRI|nr:unnamed protein product [Adineta ricciae]
MLTAAQEIFSQNQSIIDVDYFDRRGWRSNSFLNSQWKDIILSSALIILFLLTISCFYYQQPLREYILKLWKRKMNENNDDNEQNTILNPTPPLQQPSSTYLTVPEPYYHRS